MRETTPKGSGGKIARCLDDANENQSDPDKSDDSAHQTLVGAPLGRKGRVIVFPACTNRIAGLWISNDKYSKQRDYDPTQDIQQNLRTVTGHDLTVR